MFAIPRPPFFRTTSGKIHRLCLLFVGMLIVVAVCSVTLYGIRRPERTLAMKGKDVAEAMGCFACHGPEGIGGISDPLSPAGRMPGWEKGTAVMYVDNHDEIAEWILHGMAIDDAAAVPVTIADENLEPMPGYESWLNDVELKALEAYFIAVAEYYPDMPDEAYEGGVIAKTFGCIGCHGASGMGGMKNPGSFTGIIPAWNGQDYEELVRDDEELAEWILFGTSSRLMEHPIGRFFLERQVIQMPAYRSQLSKDQLDKLMKYINWLRGREAKDKEAENPIA